MPLVVVGTSHKFSDLEDRERYFFSSQDVCLFSRRIMAEGVARGVVIVSTCQRVEVYAESANAAGLKQALLGFKEIKDRGAVSYTMTGAQAIEHLFLVACGLDSGIVGETEILRQVKAAYQRARIFSTTTSFLNRLFERSLFVGKLARSRTTLGRKNPNLGQIVVAQAERLGGRLDSKKIYVIGSGVVAQSVVSACARRNRSIVIVASRNIERAKALAGEFGTRAVTFDEFYKGMGSADIIVSATASPHVMIHRSDFPPFPARSVLIFDLAVPRDIDPDIGRLDGVRLIDLDGLGQDIHLDHRSFNQAREIVTEKTGSFVLREELCGASVSV